ncbi:MAG: FKBP-type peptidyl-prolyl cis-trans isomerase [Bacteroidales bacterium]
MKKIIYIGVCLVGIYIFIACNRTEENCIYVRGEEPENTDKERMEKANQALLKNEIERMEQLIVRSGWKMEKTNTGLYYDIYAPSKVGAAVEYGNAVVISGNLKLLNGQEIYNSQTDGNKKFVIGKGQVEIGLEQAVMLMKKGDKAHLIIPSHLGYGLVGDGNRIPPKASLIYDITIEKVYEKKQ